MRLDEAFSIFPFSNTQFILNLELVRMYVIHESLRKKPKCRVHLHVHLEGSVRHETIWEILRKKKLPLPGNGSLEDLKLCSRVVEPKDLGRFLEPLKIFMPALIDDVEAVERISYEFVEDQARQSVLYCEVRLCPQLLLSEFLHSAAENGSGTGTDKEPNGDISEGKSPLVSLTSDSVIEACLRGLRRGEEQFATKVRLILFCHIGRPEWSWDTLRLCEKYTNQGVVGIDIAGYKELNDEFKNSEEVKIFEKAKEKGIHITVHAGEIGAAHEVQKALSFLKAERIGHGYHVVEDEDLYQQCLEDRVHFEMCPHSSYLTGAIKNLKLESKRHPILRLAEDGASFSINTDNPAITNADIGDEYKLLQTWGFSEAHFIKANFEAANRSFLPLEEKDQLLNQLREAYGLPKYPTSQPISPSQSPSPPSTLTPSRVKLTKRIKPEFKIASWKDRSD